ncbi:hypothetical protein KC19_6G224700 [Ceratodon purpureus]|uniref:Uncharacterized protein n=1 Tax=Ceratodon purpureus TaxID=3225 RepID=A0A8T0HKD6_CERPU|nr:hypothetical protein KC19_6G223400 [Ceratodon purpureus]KAG0571274.1 hypothetical protein KC19_6G224700 [Ceratodon purpureus]
MLWRTIWNGKGTAISVWMVQLVEVSGVHSFRISTHLNQKHLYSYSVFVLEELESICKQLIP